MDAKALSINPGPAPSLPPTRQQHDSRVSDVVLAREIAPQSAVEPEETVC